MNCKAECSDCKAAPAKLHELWPPGRKKKEEKREREKERENRGERPSPPRLFDAGTIFKLSASAYNARVKSCRVDFFIRVHELSGKTSEMRGELRAASGDPEGEMNQAHPRHAGHTLGWHWTYHSECWRFLMSRMKRNKSIFLENRGNISWKRKGLGANHIHFKYICDICIIYM